MAVKYSEAQAFYIDLLRSMVSMRVKRAEGSAYQVHAKLGDAELWEDLRLGMNMFNTTPPRITTLTYKDLYSASDRAKDAGEAEAAPEEDASSILSTPILMCALFFVGLRLQWFEAGVHFQYNDNGISLARDKQPKYQAIVSGNILPYIQQQLPQLRKQLAFSAVSPKGSFSGMVAFPRSLTRGLRGTRLGLG